MTFTASSTCYLFFCLTVTCRSLLHHWGSRIVNDDIRCLFYMLFIFSPFGDLQEPPASWGKPNRQWWHSLPVLNIIYFFALRWLAMPHASCGGGANRRWWHSLLVLNIIYFFAFRWLAGASCVVLGAESKQLNSRCIPPFLLLLLHYSCLAQCPWAFRWGGGGGYRLRPHRHRNHPNLNFGTKTGIITVVETIKAF